MEHDHEFAGDAPPFVSVGGGVDANALPEYQEIIADSRQVTWSSFHWVIVPVVGDSKGHVVTVILSHEHGHFCPVLTSADLFAAD